MYNPHGYMTFRSNNLFDNISTYIIKPQPCVDHVRITLVRFARIIYDVLYITRTYI